MYSCRNLEERRYELFFFQKVVRRCPFQTARGPPRLRSIDEGWKEARPTSYQQHHRRRARRRFGMAFPSEPLLLWNSVLNLKVLSSTGRMKGGDEKLPFNFLVGSGFTSPSSFAFSDVINSGGCQLWTRVFFRMIRMDSWSTSSKDGACW